MSKTDKNMFELTAEMTKIGNRAVRKAQEENRKLGIPNVYAKRGQIYYQLPDGRITTKKAEMNANHLSDPSEEYQKRERNKKSEND
jgi:hypothetical protein